MSFEFIYSISVKYIFNYKQEIVNDTNYSITIKISKSKLLSYKNKFNLIVSY